MMGHRRAPGVQHCGDGDAGTEVLFVKPVPSAPYDG